MNAAFENRIAGREISVVNTMTEDERTRLLSFVIFPDDTRQQDRIDTAAQTPDSTGRVLCWRRRRQCNNPDCSSPKTGKPYRFKGEDHHLWNCPICGHDRHCRNKTQKPNRGCHKHGGKTPVGFDLPQTKTGEHSKYIKVDSLREDFERMLASPQLFDITEHIAFKKAVIAEIMGEYGGGLSRELLKQMEKNRRDYKAELSKPMREDGSGPNPILLRQLDYDLDQLIAKGSSNHQVDADWNKATSQLMRLIAARDKHVENERLMITSDKAHMMLAYVEETFAFGLHMLLQIRDSDIDDLLKQMDIHFENDLTRDERIKMKEGLYAFQKIKKDEILAYASERFKELAGSGMV